MGRAAQFLRRTFCDVKGGSWLLRAVAFAILFLGSFAQLAQAEVLSWETQYGANTNILGASSATTPNIITVTSSGAGAGTTTARTIDILPGTTVNTHLGVVQSSMNATVDDLSVSNTITFGFSNPVYNLCFTVVDIDGSPTDNSAGPFFDIVQFGPVPSSAPSIGSNVVYNALTGRANSNGLYVNNTTSDLRVCFAGPISTVTVQHIAGGAFGTDPTTQNISVDDLTYDTPPTVTISKVSNGGVGTFGFTGDNGFTAHNVTTVAAGVAVAGPRRILSSPSTATVLTEGAPPAGFALTGITCAGLGTGGTATNNLAARTVTFNAAATALNSNIACTFTNTRATIRVQKITLGGVGGPFTFAQTNLAAAPGGITTVTAGVAAPVAPAAINVTTIGTAVTLTETPIAGYQLTAVSCTDANSAVTGNLGTFGSFAGSVVTVAAARIVAGADISCVLTNTRATLAVQKITLGGFGGAFTFTDTNVPGSPPDITTTAINTPTPAAPTVRDITTVGTAVAITETPIAGYVVTAASCTDANSAATGNVGAIGTLAGNVLTIPAGNVVAGSAFTCVFTNSRSPTIRIQKTTLGGFGGPFTFADTNITGAIANITTVAAGTPTPAAPATSTITTIGTAVTVTEGLIAGYALTAASCTDANSAVTGNTGSIGSFAGNVLTIPAANVVAGADFTCVFTNTRATMKVQKITLGGVGGAFTFAQTNLAAAPGGITTTLVNTATPAAPTAINIMTLGTAVTLTETPIAGYALTAVSCTDANSAVTGNAGTFGSFAGNVVTVAAARIVAGADITCVFTNTRATMKVQKITLGGVGGPFTFAQTNLAAAPGGITTVTVAVAAPAAPAAINVSTIGTAVTLTETPIAGYALTAVSCTDANSAVTGNAGAFGSFAGNVVTVAAARIVAGADITCVITNSRTPTVKTQKITLGGVGGPFTFAQTNLAAAPGGITTVTVAVAAPAAPAAINVSTIGTAVTLTETPIAGYVLTAVSCTDANSAVTGNVGTFGSFAGNVVTVAAARIVAGADITCAITNTRTPTVKVQKITVGDFGGPFTFAQTNLASAPAGITTLAANTATPAAPTAINVTAIGTAVTLTETLAAQYVLTTASCTDANSAVTGNAGPIGAVAALTLTIPAANVVAGADFTCIFTNTKLIPALAIVKVADTAGPVALNDVITYTYTVTNSGNTTITGISVSETFNGYGAAPAPGGETLSADVAPLGDSTDAGANGSWDTIGPGDTVTFTATYTVTQQDVDLLQ